MSLQGMFGSFGMPNRTWKPRVQVSDESVGFVPHENLTIDPFLPAIGIDPFDPAAMIAIPQGRIVSVGYTNGQGGSHYRFLYNDTGLTPLTLHDGLNLTPAGMSINQMYKRASVDAGFLTDSPTVKFKKSFSAEVPFVLSVNNAHGALKSGDRYTGYFGSTTTQTPGMLHRGKPVLWNPKRVYTDVSTASAVQVLDAAVYPGIVPEFVMAFAAGVFLPSVSCSFAFNGSAWQASFTGTGSGTVTAVMYRYGQEADQIAGEVVRIQSLKDMLDRDSFQKWVEYAPIDYLNYPPAAQRYPVVQILNETPSTVVAGSQYRTQYYPISVWHAVTVSIKGTVVDMNGVATTYTDWFDLPTTGTQDTRQWFMGNYHNVNWRTGIIELTANIVSVSAIKVSYSYTSNPRDGAALWGGGVWNLTDGNNVNTLGGTPYSNNAAGVPAHLNMPDVVAGMRLIVY